MADRALEEQPILQQISEKVGIKFNPNYGELEISNSNSPDKWTDFELLIFERERLKKSKNLIPDQNMYEDMLDDLVHMNDCMLFTLNPYKYAIWSPELQNFLNNRKEELLKSAAS